MITALGNTALKTGSICSFTPVIPINKGSLTPLSRRSLPCLTLARNVMRRSHAISHDRVSTGDEIKAAHMQNFFKLLPDQLALPISRV